MGKIFHKRTRKAMNSESVKTELKAMDHGEIAVNFRKGDECLVFKNSIGSLKKIMSDSFNRDKFLSHDNPNFKRFETKVEFQEAFDAGEIVYPCVSYIVDTNEYHYMTPPVSQCAYHLRAEADYAAEYYEIIRPVIEGGLPNYIEGGYIILYMGMPFFTSFMVNGVEMIDEMTTVYPGQGDLGVQMILVPFEEGAVWDVKLGVPEGGFFIDASDPEMEEAMSSFLMGINFICAPYTELYYDDTLYYFLNGADADTGSETIMPFFLGIYYGGAGIKKITYTGDFPFLVSNATSEEELDAFAQATLYTIAGNGIYSRMYAGLVNTSPLEICIPAGNATYGNPDDISDLNTANTMTVYGLLNGMIQSGEWNFEITITEY